MSGFSIVKEEVPAGTRGRKSKYADLLSQLLKAFQDDRSASSFRIDTPEGTKAMNIYISLKNQIKRQGASDKLHVVMADGSVYAVRGKQK